MLCTTLLALPLFVAPLQERSDAVTAPRTREVIVRDAETGAPVAGASLWTSGSFLYPELAGFALEELSTDARGRAQVSLDALEAMRPLERSNAWIEVVAAHPGYASSNEVVWGDELVAPGDEADAAVESGDDVAPPLEFRLRPAVSVLVHVVDAHGRGVGDVHVLVRTQDPDDGTWSASWGAGETWTEAGGQGSLVVYGDEAVEVSAWHPLHGLARARLGVEQLAQPLTLVLEPTPWRVRGRVTAADGTPLAHLPVVVRTASDLGGGELALDDAGGFEAFLPDESEAKLLVRLLDDVETPLAPGAAAVEVVVPDRVLVLELLDEHGAAFRGVQPWLAPVAERGTGAVEVDLTRRCASGALACAGGSSDGVHWFFRVAGGGRYAARGVQAGWHDEWIGEQTFAPPTSRRVSHAALRYARAPKSGPICIELSDAQGVRVAHFSGKRYSATTGQPVGEFDEHGLRPIGVCGLAPTPEFRWPAGRYRLVVEAPGHRPAEALVTLAPGEATVVRLQSPGPSEP